MMAQLKAESAGALATENEVVDAGEHEAGDEELDEESTKLLAELEESQAEVQRMLENQRQQASELGGMKDHLASELQQLQDEAWKLQVFAELEMLKRQLAAINSLDADLDVLEEKLEAGAGEGEGEEEQGSKEGEPGAEVDDEIRNELAAARAETARLLAGVAKGGDGAAAAGGGEGEGAAAASGAAGDEGAGGDDVAALQDELDAELAAMYKQLQAIKAESAMVAARKAQLEMELMSLIKEGADELAAHLQELDVVGEEGEEGAGAEAEEGKGQAQAAAAES